MTFMKEKRKKVFNLFLFRNENESLNMRGICYWQI